MIQQVVMPQIISLSQRVMKIENNKNKGNKEVDEENAGLQAE